MSSDKSKTEMRTDNVATRVFKMVLTVVLVLGLSPTASIANSSHAYADDSLVKTSTDDTAASEGAFTTLADSTSGTVDHQASGTENSDQGYSYIFTVTYPYKKNGKMFGHDPGSSIERSYIQIVPNSTVSDTQYLNITNVTSYDSAHYWRSWDAHTEPFGGSWDSSQNAWIYKYTGACDRVEIYTVTIAYEYRYLTPTGLQGDYTGTITGLDSDFIYEYKLDTTDSWDDATTVSYQTEITNLAAGNYDVRVKSDGREVANVNPSKSVRVVIPVASITTGEGESATTSYYASLAEAVSAATDGQTISLLTDITQVSTISLDKSISLDLNGKTLSSASEGTGMLFDVTTGNLNITGTGTIDTTAFPDDPAGAGNAASIRVQGSPESDAAYDYGVTVGEDVTLRSSGNAVLVENASANNAYGVTVNLNSKSITAGRAACAISASETGTEGSVPQISVGSEAVITSTADSCLNLAGYAKTAIGEGAILTGAGTDAAAVDISAGELTITGGTFSGTYGIHSRCSDLDQILDISGGTFNGSELALNVDATQSSFAGTRSFDIAGGTYSSDPSAYVSTGYEATKSGDAWTVAAAEYKQQIDDTSYRTLADAVAAVPSDGTQKTITLLGDTLALDVTISDGQNVILDLAGHTVTTSAETANELIVVANGGTLTVTDSSESKAGKIDSNGLTLAIKMTNEDEGAYGESKTASLIVNGGTIIGEVCAIAGVDSKNNTSVTINGGTIKAVADDGTAIYNPQSGTVLVTGGTIEGDAGIYVDSDVTTTLSGGTIKATGDALVVYNSIYPEARPTTTINGATLECGDSGLQVNARYGLSEKNISDIFSTNNTLTVPAGYEWVATENAGTYKLRKHIDPVVAAVDEDEVDVTVDEQTSVKESALSDALKAAVQAITDEIKNSAAVTAEGATNIQSISGIDTQVRIGLKALSVTTPAEDASTVAATTVAAYDASLVDVSGNAISDEAIAQYLAQSGETAITFRLAVPSTMSSNTVKLEHKDDSGNVVDTLTEMVQGEGNDRYVNVSAASLGTFELSQLTAENSAAKITDASGEVYYYPTVEGALAAANSGDTVVLLADSDYSFTLNIGVNFDTNGKSYTGAISAPDNDHYIKSSGNVRSVAEKIVKLTTASSKVTAYYDSFADAAAAANSYADKTSSGDVTLELYKDVTLTESVKLVGTDYYLGGSTTRVNNTIIVTGNHTLSCSTSARLTAKQTWFKCKLYIDGDIDGNLASGKSPSATAAFYGDAASQIVFYSDIHITGSTSGYAYSYCKNNYANVAIDGTISMGTFANGCVIKPADGKTVTVTGGTFMGKSIESATIYGGTFSGSSMEVKNATIYGGAFSQTSASKFTNVTLMGGTFSFDPSGLVAPGYKAEADSSGKYVISPDYSSVNSESDPVEVTATNGMATIAPSTFADAAAASKSVTIKAEGIATITFDADAAAKIAENAGSKAVVFTASTKTGESAESEISTAGVSKGKVVSFTMTAGTSDVFSSDNAGGSAKATIPYTDSVAAGWRIAVYNVNGSAATKIEDATYDSDDKTASFTINHFSDYVIGQEEKTYTAMIGETEYATLADAVEAVQDGETIVLGKNNAEAITVSRVVKFSLNTNNKSFTGSLTAGTNYTLTQGETETGLTYEFAESQVIVCTTSVISGTDTTVAMVSGGGIIGAVTGTTLSAPSVVGYTFKGWYTNYSKDTQASSWTLISNEATTTYAPTSDVTAYAVYDLNSTSTFDLEVTGSCFSVNGSAQEDYYKKPISGGEVTVSYTDPNKTFLYWVNGSGSLVSTSANYTFTLVADTELKAVAASNSSAASALVVFKNSFALGAQQLLVERYTYDGTNTLSITYPSIPSLYGRTFQYWAIGVLDEEGNYTAGAEATAENIAAAISGGAKFVLIAPMYESNGTYDVITKFVDASGSSISADATTHVDMGKARTLTARAIDGHAFSYWKDASGNIVGTNSQYTVLSNAEVTITAVYDAGTVDPVSTISTIASRSMNGAKYRMTFCSAFSIDSNKTIAKRGFLYTTASTTLTYENKENLSVYEWDSVTDNTGVMVYNINTSDPALEVNIRPYVITSDGTVIYGETLTRSYGSMSE